MNELNLNNEKCEKCPSLCKSRKQVVNGNGPLNAKILIIGEAPGPDENESGQPFIGRAGQHLSKLLAQAGIDRSQVRISNAVRCFPKNEDKNVMASFRAPTFEEITACREYLKQEINAIKPNVIVPVGSAALAAVLGSKAAAASTKITKVRGTEFWSEELNCKIMPTFHPSAVMRDPNKEPIVIQDFNRIRESSQYKELSKGDEGNYITLDTIDKVDAFFDRMKEVQNFVFDIETNSLDWQTGEILCIAFSWKAKTACVLPITKYIGIPYQEIEIKKRKSKKKVDGKVQVVEIEKQVAVDKIKDTYAPAWGDKQDYVLGKLKELMESNKGKIAQNCLHRDTKIRLADGTSKTIGDIVNKKLNVNVLSYNEKTGLTESKPIVNWIKKRSYDNSNEWLKIVTAKYDNFSYSYKIGPVVTTDHKVFIKHRGWIAANKIKSGDIILSDEPTLNTIQMQTILGSILGDGSISRSSKTANLHFTVSHGNKQKSYIDFKRTILSSVIKQDTYTQSNYGGFNTNKEAKIHTIQTIPLYQLESIYSLCSKNGKKIVTREFLDLLNPLGIAMWFMDDGSNKVELATGSFSKKECQIIKDYFFEHWGLVCRIVKQYATYKGKKRIYYYIKFSKELKSRTRFLELISPYVIPSLRYKLYSTREIYENLDNFIVQANSAKLLPFSNKKFEMINEFIPIEIPVVSVNKYKPYVCQNVRYCIEVADNHNFFAVGTLVKNCKFDCKWFMQKGWRVNNVIFDTMLAAHLLNENNKGGLNLTALSMQYTTMGAYDRVLEEWFKENKVSISNRNYARVPEDILYKYAAMDADCTYRLFEKFVPLLAAENLTDIFNRLIIPLSSTLTEAEFYGVKIDREYLKTLKQELETDIAALEKRIKVVTGDINLNSPDQLRKLLFKDLKLPKIKKTKKGEDSTDVEVLGILADMNPIPQLILDYRKLEKLHSTYVVGIEEILDKNGYLHPSFNIHGTESGRLSSSDPNAQNIPKKDKRIKRMFAAEEGNVMVEGDLSMAEIRFWAEFSRDPQLLQDLYNGLDMHREVASRVFKIPPDQVTDDQRTFAKRTAFGLLYGMSNEKFSKQNKCSLDDAEKGRQAFFGRYPIAKQWLSHITREARMNQCVRNLFGRVRHLPGINSQDEMVKYEAEAAAKNSPIQGTASDYACNAANRIVQKFKELGLRGKLRILVHDAIIMDIPKEEFEQSINIMREEMQRPVCNMVVPMVADFGYGPNWGEMKKYEFKKEAVNSGI